MLVIIISIYSSGMVLKANYIYYERYYCRDTIISIHIINIIVVQKANCQHYLFECRWLFNFSLYVDIIPAEYILADTEASLASLLIVVIDWLGLATYGFISKLNRELSSLDSTISYDPLVVLIMGFWISSLLTFFTDRVKSDLVKIPTTYYSTTALKCDTANSQPRYLPPYQHL